MKRLPLVAIITVGMIILLAVIMHDTDIKKSTRLETVEQSPQPLIRNHSADTASTLSNTLPSSLQGTAHGITLVSHQDNFIVTASLKDVFEYYLSAAGEESLAVIEARIVEDLSQQLTGQALAQALAIWENYLTYKTALVEFDQQYQIDVTTLNTSEHLQFLQQRQLALMALQDQLFSSAIAEILFAFDRQFDNHTLEKAKLLASDLSAEQKQQGLINLTAQLPIETTLSLKRNQQQKKLLAIDQEKNLTAEQKYNLRTKQVGEAAASRLQQLDEQRQQWQQRLNHFQQQKQQLSEAGLASDDYQVSLEKLYQQHFSPAEQLRAKALMSANE